MIGSITSSDEAVRDSDGMWSWHVFDACTRICDQILSLHEDYIPVKFVSIILENMNLM